MVTVVDHHLLARALDFYESRGYTRVELPWTAPAYAMEMTNPNLLYAPKLGGFYFVASGEQAFLHCDSQSLLPPGKYVGLTPCIRPQDWVEPYHQETFYKVELYENYLSGEPIEQARAVNQMTADARDFFNQQLCPDDYLNTIATPHEDGTRTDNGLVTSFSRDIHLNGVEIGSYGVRESGEYRWAYGTGCAEPRFSLARKQHD